MIVRRDVFGCQSKDVDQDREIHHGDNHYTEFDNAPAPLVTKT
jgi:hypothetical protein